MVSPLRSDSGTRLAQHPFRLLFGAVAPCCDPVHEPREPERGARLAPLLPRVIGTRHGLAQLRPSVSGAGTVPTGAGGVDAVRRGEDPPPPPFRVSDSFASFFSEVAVIRIEHTAV